MATIKTNFPFTGLRAGVEFKRGVAHTDNEYLIEWFKEHGYEVIEPTPEEVKRIKSLEAMKVDELREYLKSHGMGMKVGSIKNKTRLVELAKEVKE